MILLTLLSVLIMNLSLWINITNTIKKVKINNLSYFCFNLITHAKAYILFFISQIIDISSCSSNIVGLLPHSGQS